MDSSFRLLSLASSFSLVAGCAGTLLPVERKEVDSAIRDRDTATLTAICQGDKRVRVDDDKRRACNHLKAQAATSGGCDTLVKRWEGAIVSEDTQRSFGEQFAACKQYTDLFERVVHWGREEEGARLLVHLEEKGLPVEAEFVRYAETHTGEAFMPLPAGRAKFALDNIGTWLIKKGHKQHCGTIAQAARGASMTAKAWTMPYFRAAKCVEGAPIAADALLSERADHRMWACDTLATIGTPANLGKVKVLGETDGYSEIREERREGRVWAVKVYPVRESCTAAAGKITLRTL